MDNASLLLVDYLPCFLHIDHDGCNNSSMMAAKEASDMVLMSLLTTLVYSTDDMTTKGEFLHHKNKSEETLLKIIISHGDTLSTHRDVIIKVSFINTTLALVFWAIMYVY